MRCPVHTKIFRSPILEWSMLRYIKSSHGTVLLPKTEGRGENPAITELPCALPGLEGIIITLSDSQEPRQQS